MARFNWTRANKETQMARWGRAGVDSLSDGSAAARSIPTALHGKSVRQAHQTITPSTSVGSRSTFENALPKRGSISVRELRGLLRSRRGIDIVTSRLVELLRRSGMNARRDRSQLDVQRLRACLRPLLDIATDDPHLGRAA